MMRIKNKDIEPPNGYRFTVSQTGFRVKGDQWWDWIAKIKLHYKANSIPLPDNIIELAEDQLCQQLPPEWCVHSDQNKPPVLTRLSLSEIFEASKAYAKLLGAKLLGMDITVSQEEADRRARICAGCYLRVSPQGCGACSRLAKLFSVDVAKLHSAHDVALDGHVCAVCRCPLRPLVHFPVEMLEKSDTREKQALYPLFCWRQKSGQNYL